MAAVEALRAEGGDPSVAIEELESDWLRPERAQMEAIGRWADMSYNRMP